VIDGPDPGLILPSRVVAAQRLAERLRQLKLETPLILAIPPGGVPVGLEISRILGVDFDLIISLKVSVPENPQRALGAVAEFGGRMTSGRRLEQTEHLQFDLDPGFGRVIREVERLSNLYREGRDPPDLAGRTVIVVTDGVVEPLIVRAALRGVAARSPHRLIFATGVLSRYCMVEIRRDVEEVIALREPRLLFSLSEWYREFPSVTEAEIQASLAGSNLSPVRAHVSAGAGEAAQPS